MKCAKHNYDGSAGLTPLLDYDCNRCWRVHMSYQNQKREQFIKSGEYYLVVRRYGFGRMVMGGYHSTEESAKQEAQRFVNYPPKSGPPKRTALVCHITKLVE